MSQHSRRKAAPPPRRKSRRESTSSSSSLDLSSDGGYSALEDLSDSEDDDEDGVDATEEKYIIKDVVHNRHVRTSPRSTAQDEDDDSDSDDVAVEDDDNEADDDDDEDEEEDDDDDDDNADIDIDDADDNISWNGIGTESEAQGGASLAPKRQVRFTGVPDSDSDSTTTEVSDMAAEYFPDIFVEQNSLDPAFRREIEDESDSTVSSSFWDYSSGYGVGGGALLTMPFSDDEPATLAPGVAGMPSTPLAPVVEVDEEEEESQEELDGYETDGDTTEDEEFDQLPVRRKAPRRIHSADGNSESDSDASDVSVVRQRRGHPRVGRFVLDANSSKPVAVMHPVTGKMVIFTPEKPRPIHQYDPLSDPFSAGMELLPPSPADLTQSSPLITNSASVMMGAMFSSHTFGDYVHSQNVGPVEAFFPTISSDAFLGDESDFSGDVLEDDGELNLRLEDFIQFERSLSDVGTVMADEDKTLLPSEADDNGLDLGLGLGMAGLVDGDDGTTPAATPTPTERRDSLSFTIGISSDGEDEEEDDDVAMPPLLAHFDKNVDAVGAFRRNQIDQQLIYSNKATAESLAFSGPYIMGTLRGIKNGSLEAVATPITPPRRRKRHDSIGVHHRQNMRDEYVRSPLSTVQKRKASGGPGESAMDHKRQRSITEVKDLML